MIETRHARNVYTHTTSMAGCDGGGVGAHNGRAHAMLRRGQRDGAGDGVDDVRHHAPTPTKGKQQRHEQRFCGKQVDKLDAEDEARHDQVARMGNGAEKDREGCLGKAGSADQHRPCSRVVPCCREDQGDEAGQCVEHEGQAKDRHVGGVVPALHYGEVGDVDALEPERQAHEKERRGASEVCSPALRGKVGAVCAFQRLVASEIALVEP